MRIFSCSISPASRGSGEDPVVAALALENGNVELWSCASRDDTRKERKHIYEQAHGNEEALRICWNRSGNLLVSGGGDGRINLLSSDLKRKSSFDLDITSEEDQAVYACWFGDDTNLRYAYYNLIDLYDTETHQCTLRLDAGHDAKLTSFRNPSGTRLVFDASESPDKSVIVAAISDGSLAYFDPRQGSEPLSVLQMHREAMTSCSFSGSGRSLVVGSIDGHASVWDVRNWKQSARTELKTSTIYGAHFAPDSETRFCSWAANVITIWEAEKAVLEHQIEFDVLTLSELNGVVLACGTLDEEDSSAHGKTQVDVGQCHSHDHRGHGHSHEHSRHGHSHDHFGHGHEPAILGCGHASHRANSDDCEKAGETTNNVHGVCDNHSFRKINPLDDSPDSDVNGESCCHSGDRISKRRPLAWDCAMYSTSSSTFWF